MSIIIQNPRQTAWIVVIETCDYFPHQPCCKEHWSGRFEGFMDFLLDLFPCCLHAGRNFASCLNQNHDENLD